MIDLFKIHLSNGLLAQFISSIVYYEGYTPQHSIEKLLPDGTLNIILELGDSPQYIYDSQSLVKQKNILVLGSQGCNQNSLPSVQQAQQ